MRLTACSLAAFALAALARADVPRDLFSQYDFSTTKVGEWAEYEVIEDEKKSKRRMACVASEGETLWIESSFTPPGTPVGATMLFAVNRESGEAWPALKFRTKERTAKIVIRLLKFGTDAKPNLYDRK
ncbi:MAG: hypothetical protein HYY18_10960 [Planctomycetes bacterium]|nr:hypothetical protein [Planctomycetota bacterium]